MGLKWNEILDCVKISNSDVVTDMIIKVIEGRCSIHAWPEELNTLTHIGGNSFERRNDLSITSLPSGLTSIGSGAFRGCTNLALTFLPEGLTNINSQAFQNCTSLTSITFQGTPSYIAREAFEGCTNLTTINVPWSEGAVANAPWGATNATINYNYAE